MRTSFRGDFNFFYVQILLVKLWKRPEIPLHLNLPVQKRYILKTVNISYLLQTIMNHKWSIFKILPQIALSLYQCILSLARETELEGSLNPFHTPGGKALPSRHQLYRTAAWRGRGWRGGKRGAPVTEGVSLSRKISEELAEQHWNRIWGMRKYHWKQKYYFKCYQQQYVSNSSKILVCSSYTILFKLPSLPHTPHSKTISPLSDSLSRLLIVHRERYASFSTELIGKVNFHRIIYQVQRNPRNYSNPSHSISQD